MKRKYRLLGMITCLFIMASGMIAMTLYSWRLEALSVLIGLAMGWGLRETLENKGVDTE